MSNRAPSLSENALKGRSVISIRDLSKDEIHLILDRAKACKEHEQHLRGHCAGKMMASCFFEPSTRTRLSFEAAMKRLGGDVIGFADGATSATAKGESLADSMRVISGYVDLIVIRHSERGAAKEASGYAKVPIINAGDGSNEHPTQTLVDLFAMRENRGELDNLHIAFVGDLKHSRTVHSLAIALKAYRIRLSLVSPSMLALPSDLEAELKASGIAISHHERIDEIIEEVDFIYMTRIQKERFLGDIPNEKELCAPYRLTAEIAKRAKSHMKVLQPLPRYSEIPPEIDELPCAYYFQQAKDGLFVREALVSLIL